MPAKSYNLDEEEYIFRLKENITVYLKPEGRKKLLLLTEKQLLLLIKKESLYPCKLIMANGETIYLKVKNKRIIL